MKTIYECEHCGKQFSDRACCAYHEVLHLKNLEKIKYYLINISPKDVCDCCANAYWVYGCERDCSYVDCKHNNNYKDFKPRMEE